ncbi:MAG TPA: Na+/H+ antiporter subunit E [Mycobacteriales bacterium]|nr:Na+/H+ antiporter subunit E [Mycobacteriales bacterium]
MKRVLALALWSFAVWVLLTWTATIEQEAFGVAIALVVAVALAPLGDVIVPWRLLDPRVLTSLVRLSGFALIQIARANVILAWRVWHRRPYLRSGLVITPTRMQSDAGLAAVGLVSSLIVDNQIVDVDRASHELLYHAVVVPEGGRVAAYHRINARLEDHLLRLVA